MAEVLNAALGAAGTYRRSGERHPLRMSLDSSDRKRPDDNTPWSAGATTLVILPLWSTANRHWQSTRSAHPRQQYAVPFAERYTCLDSGNPQFVQMGGDTELSLEFARRLTSIR